MKYLIITNNSGGLYRFRKELLEHKISLDNDEIFSLVYLTLQKNKKEKQ